MPEATKKQRGTDEPGTEASGTAIYGHVYRPYTYESKGPGEDPIKRPLAIGKLVPIILGDEIDIKASRKKPTKVPVSKTAPVNRGPDVSEPVPPKPPQPPPQVVADEPSDADIARQQAFIERVTDETKRAEAEVRGLVNRYGKGEEVTAREATRAGTRAIEGERTSGLLGSGEGDGSKAGIDITDLNKIGASQVGKAIRGVVAEFERSIRIGERGQPASAAVDLSQKGNRPIPKRKLRYFAGIALGIERQQQLLGGESLGGTEQARRLVAIALELVRREIRSVIARASQGERIGPAYIEHLNAWLTGLIRQESMSGGLASTAEQVEWADASANIPRLSLEEEARDVLDRANSGQRFDDDYVDYLRERLDKNSDLSGDLYTMQGSQFAEDVTKVLSDATKGKRFEEFELAYLRDRAKEFEAQDTNPGRKSRWKEYSIALDWLIVGLARGSRDSSTVSE